MRRPVLLPAIVLFLLTCLLLLYRVLWLGYPVLPVIQEQVWQLVIHAYLAPNENESTLRLALPLDHAGNMLVEERIVSGSYTFNTVVRGPNRFGVWSGERVGEPEEIQYRAVIHTHPRRGVPNQSPLQSPFPAALSREEQTLAEGVALNWLALGPALRLRAVVATLRGQPEESPQRSELLRRWRLVQQRLEPMDAALALLKASNLPARPVEGLRLTEGVQILTTKWIEVWTEGGWRHLNPETKELYSSPPALLPLAVGGWPAVNITGGKLSDIRWTITRQLMSQWMLFYERIAKSPHFLDRWSLLQLPQEFQGTFRVLLLVPIGALIISVLRNVVGLPTFGIFMPMLIALAFRNTGGLFGVLIFSGVLLIGYAARSFLDKLHLLLIPRLSVILTLVVSCFTLLAVVGNKLGLRELMAVGLIPFVILTMTIERFFILIEESGVGEALRTAVGSIAVSVIAYGIISYEPLQLTFFIYPELILTVAALQILIGRYTGYRLSELYRFKKLGELP